MKKNMTLSEIRLRGNKVLFDELGPVAFIRFMQQFVSRGDYTKDRQKWIGKVDLSDVQRRGRQAQAKKRWAR